MDAVNEVLAHYGVLGMHWGVRKGRGLPTAVVLGNKKGRVSAKGGENQPAHDDAKIAAKSKRVAKKSSTDALSTEELQHLVNRMNLEQQYAKLSTQTKPKNAGSKLAGEVVQSIAKQQATKYGNDKVAQVLSNAAKKKK